MSKIVMKCIGKYLSGTGIEHAFTENRVFGVSIMSSILKGNNYNRSLK